jgi:RNA polymerase sigma factor (sigma-70 family)
VPSPFPSSTLTETVEQVMRGLNERERAMLGLGLQGYTVQEISSEVGRSERTVQRLLKRVRRELERMQADDPG